MTNKIISSEKDLLGVVFFGTDKDENKGGFKHVYVLQVRSQVRGGILWDRQG